MHRLARNCGRNFARFWLGSGRLMQITLFSYNRWRHNHIMMIAMVIIIIIKRRQHHYLQTITDQFVVTTGDRNGAICALTRRVVAINRRN